MGTSPQTRTWTGNFGHQYLERRWWTSGTKKVWVNYSYSESRDDHHIITLAFQESPSIWVAYGSILNLGRSILSAYWTNKVAEVTRVPTALQTASIAANKTMDFPECMLEGTIKFWFSCIQTPDLLKFFCSLWLLQARAGSSLVKIHDSQCAMMTCRCAPNLDSQPAPYDMGSSCGSGLTRIIQFA
jgi:hypothetical protein